MSPSLPRLAVTMGDPAGIGPEICARALLDPSALAWCRPVLVGDRTALSSALSDALHMQAEIHTIGRPAEGVFEPGVINLIDLGLLRDAPCPIGQVSALGGECAFRYVERAIRLAMDGEADATVTAPLNKEALHLAGHPFAGHTEIYAHLTGCKNYTMMLAHQHVRVVHVSTHVSLREACDRVKKTRVLSVIRLAHEACQSFGIARPRIAVAGLNPHSGEGGLFGREEVEEILPAVQAARGEGFCVDGPIPPDTVFCKLNAGLYDVCVAMYHDQGHIPVKLLGFTYDEAQGRWNAVSGVNITMGLPIIRVSVDHGTAFDIAGKGIAACDSLMSAMDYAARMALHRA